MFSSPSEKELDQDEAGISNEKIALQILSPIQLTHTKKGKKLSEN